MSNLRESYAGTAYASLAWTEERERAIDKVAASGKCSPLGVMIWKAKYMLEAKAYQDAISGLLLLYKARYSPESEGIASKCVEQALSEFLGPACPTCTGSQERMVEGLKVLCPVCGGSGLRRYSDGERSGRMRLSLGTVRRHQARLQWLAGELGAMDRAVNQVLAQELERA